MRVGLTSVAAGAAILVLLGAGYALTVRSAATHRSEQAQSVQISRISADIAAEAHRLDVAGRKALNALRNDDDFNSAQAAFQSLSGKWLTINALASFEPRQSAPALRRAEPIEAAGAAPAPMLPSTAMALREDASEAARMAGSAQKLSSPTAIVIAPNRPAPATDSKAPQSAWIFWGGAAGRSVAARIEWSGALFSKPSSSAPIATLELAKSAAALEPSQRIASHLGDRVLTIAPAPLEGRAVSADYLTALENFGPSILGALLLGGLFLAQARGAEARADDAKRRNAEMLSNIEAQQAELEESKERFQHLAESTNVIPWSADLSNQRFLYVGPQIEGLTGFSSADWRAVGFWAQHVHPNDRTRVLVDEIPKLSSGRYATLNYRVRGANGKILHMRNMLSVNEELNEETGETRMIARGFLLDVTSMKRAAAALEVARRRAEDANRVKSEFLASMSHELRTPLNAVIGFSEIMKDELFGPLDERYREYSESVHASGKHLLSLINDVLDLSKIEAGHVELNEDETNIADMLDDCRTLLLERTNSAGLNCTLSIQPALPSMRIDERRMKQVILNLVSNSIKFTDPGGEVEIGAENLPTGGVRLWVRDTGCGMTPEQIPVALAKFGQADGDLDRQHQGTGLGLPIAKSLVEMHGGTFEIRSKQGEGTIVALLLPENRVLRQIAGGAQAAQGQNALHSDTDALRSDGGPLSERNATALS